LPCRGTYFQLADYSALRPDLDDVAFARWLTIEHGIASIPVSAFYQHPPEQQLVRFCFAKREETLDAAVERLQGLKA
jgi:methionine transaminase